jgi:hypothetical protein
LKLGQIYGKLEHRQHDAKRELRQATELAPDEGLIYPQAAYELGLLHLKVNELEEAIQWLDVSAALFEALMTSPTNNNIEGTIDSRMGVEANLQLGRAYLKAHQPQQAKEALNRAKKQLEVVFRSLDERDIQLQQAIEVALAESNAQAGSGVLSLVVNEA